ncbi:uncharacterized protein METZ01_LOCUS483445 [marine metagenome]|uniref:Uncharacterized protein n=1 Tax=marine metagenome TaxID=408172 RepID=A0A383CEJ9_9ZZZZ
MVHPEAKPPAEAPASKIVTFAPS